MTHFKFEQLFLHSCRKQLGLTEQDFILLAVSGGLDSMVMLYLFHRFHFRIEVAHCNFNLRGTESERDQSFCENQASEFNIPIHTKKFDTALFASNHAVSIQMAARSLRYEWFTALKDTHHFNYVATAHHKDDQAETILMNLMAGKGVSSLSGIPPKNKFIVRPLLPFTKAEIKTYALEKGIAWREDESNAQTDYERNYFRHKIIPTIQVLNPSIQDTLVRMGNRLKEVSYLGEENAKKILETCIEVNKDYTVIHFTSLLQHPSANYLLWMAIKEFGFSGDIMEDIIAASTNPGKVFHSSTSTLRIDRNTFIIEKRNADTYFETTLSLEMENIDLPGGKLYLQPITVTPEMIHATSKDTTYVDAAILKYPLAIRTWKKGDHFFPLGMNQKKKLSDYFIDNKIPIHQKEKKLLLMSGDEIVWIIGDRLDHRYRITSATQSILQIKWKDYE